ncbi:hypothetical protein ACOSP7_002721 [Xanthoceras sorbifolium]
MRTKSVLYIYHRVLKFPVGDHVGVIHGDQQLARKCYVAPTNRTALLKHCVQEEIMEIEIDEEHSEVQKEKDKKRVPRRQEYGTPINELESVSIKDNDSSKMVRICVNFWKRASITESSPIQEHFRCTIAFHAMGCIPHWTSSHVQGISKICNHCNGLLHTMGRS